MRSFSELGVAVVGTGFIGPVHIEALRRLGIKVTGILGSSPEKSTAAAEQIGLTQGYQSMEALLEDSSVAAVHITSPNSAHFEQAKAALLADKHVLCEKPLTIHSSEAAELVHLAADRGLHAGICHNMRFYPLNLEVRQRIQNGEAGRIHHIMGAYHQDWLLYPTDYNWRVLVEKNGPLRAVADIGTHWIDLVTFLTGTRVTAVFADLRIVHQQRFRPAGEVGTFSGAGDEVEGSQPVSSSTDDCAVLILELSDGARACVSVSQVAPGRKNCIRYEISGSKCAFAWDGEEPNSLWIGHRSQPNEHLVRDPALLSASVSRYADYPGGHAEGFPDTFKQLFRSFYESVLGLDSAVGYPTFEDGRAHLKVCEAILESARRKQWVAIS